MASPSEWRIHRRRGECVDCGRPFEDGERVLSSLVVREGELARLDRCPACHAARAEARTGGGAEETAPSGGESGERAAATTEAGAGDTVLYWWANRFRAQRKPSLQLDLESLERLFLDLEGREERLLRELRYLIALLLMRKRRLKLVGVRRGREGEAMLVRRPRRQESLTVFVFDFDSERMGFLRERLQDLLDGAAPEELSEAAASASEPPASDPAPQERGMGADARAPGEGSGEGPASAEAGEPLEAAEARAAADAGDGPTAR